MKKYILPALTGLALMTVATGCIEEFDPQSSTVTIDQANGAIGSFENFVTGITNNLTGQFCYSGASTDAEALSYPYDFGYPSMFLWHDTTGQDIVVTSDGSYWSYSYIGAMYYGMAGWALNQYPMTIYYQWVRSCNTVIEMGGDEPAQNRYSGVGIAHAMRAMFYLDMAQMYSPTSYKANPDAPTVPYVTDKTTINESFKNPRMPYKEMLGKIIEDLDKAEFYLADYVRPNVFTPDLSVVYGLKARTYLVMENWSEAEKYARMALDQGNYTAMTPAEYTDRNTGFNTPNGAWMFGGQYRQIDPNIYLNDGDHCWASMMSLEITSVSGCGYAANYGYPYAIDRHLYETIPATDCRKKCFIDFSVNDMEGDELVNFLAENYSDYPETLAATTPGSNYDYGIAGLSVKFRVTGGKEGHDNQYKGFSVAVPFMRAEEMLLIEAEAAGMQSEGRGIQLLTQFVQNYRDPSYVYGTHNEAYYNDQTSAFQNEVWWQRRAELWGEGFSMYDIKRLNKGIIRSYEGTNHMLTYRYNHSQSAVEPSAHFPCWMATQLGGTESYNTSLVQNPFSQPEYVDSPEFTW